MKFIKIIALVGSVFFHSLMLANTRDNNIASINAAIIDDQQTITVFFDKAQTLSNAEAQKLFTIAYAYEYLEDQDQRKPLETGKWHLSSDGYQLSYYPVPMGSYLVTNSKDKAQQGTEVYVGRAGKAVNILGRGPVLPINVGSLPIEAIGTDKVDIEFFKIDNPTAFFERFYLGSSFDRYDLDSATKNMTPAGIFRYNLPKSTPLDKKTDHRIPIDKNMKAGAYVVTVSPAGQIYKTLDTRIIFLSDIGLHARRYPQKTLIMAHHFSSLKPAKDAKLEIWGKGKNNKLKITEETCQFQDGSCVINRALVNSDVVVVKSGEDVSMLPMRELALDLNDFAVLGDDYAAQPVHIYSNRELYRPGEEIIINALLRNQDGMQLPKQTLELRLINPEGKVVQTSNLQEEAQGFYQTHLATSNDAKTGNWRIEMRTDASMSEPNGVLNLYIEEFMPERMELVLKPSSDTLNYEQSLKVNIASRYLFGAVAKNNAFKNSVYLRVLHNPYPKHKDWYVGNSQYPSHLLEEREFELTGDLNDQGEFDQIIDLPFTDDNKNNSKKMLQVIRATGTVKVMDGNALGISRSFKADFWPAVATVPVIRPLFADGELGYGQKASFELFSADKKGVLVNSDLRLTLKYKSHYCTWVYSESRGWDCHRRNDAEIHEQKIVKTGKEPFVYTLDPNSWGDYQLIVTDVKTGFATSYNFSSSWNESETGQLPVAKPMALDIATHKPSFKDGDTVNVTFDAPYAGNLMVMIEADAPLFQQSLKVKEGKNSFKIKLDDKWQRHDLYLTALLLGKNSKDEVTRALGIIPLKLDRLERKLKAKLEFPTVTKPDQTIKIKLKVDNLPKNKKTYATISVTDQGILNMTPSKPVNIFDAFFGKKKYSVDIVDYYNRLFKNSSKSLLTPQFGGDGDTGNKSGSNLTEMKTVSISSNLLTVNEQGEAIAEFSLPDFNGEAKVVAKVFSDQSVGQTSEQMTIRAPIVADLVTPKFIRVGDEAYVSLSLHNLSGKADKVKIKLSSKEFDINFDKSIELKNQESMRELIPIKLNDFHYKAVVSLDIDSTSFKAVRTYRIGTVHFAEESANYERLLLDKNERWERNLNLRNVYGADASEVLIVSRTPIINVLTYTDGLFGYPYGCTEQTASRAFPWLFKSHPLLDYEKNRSYESYKNEKAETKNVTKVMSYEAWEADLMASAVRRITNRQLSNGGFSLWDHDGEHFPASVYATDFLYQASKKYPSLVRGQVLNKASSYLKNRLTGFAKDIEGASKYRVTSSYLNDMTYATWILAREGKIFSADLTEFNKSHILKEMSPLSRAYVAAAHFILGNDAQGQHIMSQVSFADWKSRYGYFYTGVAETALTIDLINQLRVRGLYKNSADLVSDLSKVLHEKLKERRYFSTQERYALIKIGIDTPQDNNPIVVDLDGKKTNLVSGKRVDVSKVKHLQSNEPLFMEYQVQGYPQEKRNSQNFEMTHNIDYKGIDHKISKDHYVVKVGDRFLVQTNIRSERSLPNALLVAQIPGGFNVLNPNLLGENADEFYSTFGESYGRSSLDHEEFRFSSYVASLPMNANTTYKFAYVIEAAVPGTYDMPAFTLEDMYAPTLKNTIFPFKDVKITIQKP